MADRRLSIEVIADASKFSDEMKVAAKAAQDLHDRADSLAKQLDAADEQRANLRKERIDALTKTEKNELSKRLVDANQHIADLKQLYAKNEKAAGDAEQQITQLVKTENASRTAAVKSSFSEVAASAKTMAISIAAAFGLINIGYQIINGIKSAVTGYGDLGHEVMHLADIMGTTTEKASVLDYIFKQFGLTSANVTQTIAQLTRHVVDNEKDFNALGVQTRDTNGNLLSTYDIFMSLRQVMSNAADGTAKTADMLKLLARSGSAGGQALGELQQILGLTNDQMAAMERQAQANNAVLNKSQALMGTDMVQAGRELSQAIDGLGRSFGALVVGPLTGVINAVSTAISMFELLTSTAAASMSAFQGIPVLSGLLNLAGNTSDIISGNPTDALASIHDKMQQIEADRKTLADLGASDGTAQMPTFAPGGGSGQNPAVQALQDESAALRDLATQKKQDLQDELTGITTAHDAAIADLRDEQTASQAAHDAAIQQIRDETQALEDQYTARERGRQDEIQGLRDQLSLIDQQFAAQQAQDQLARDQQSLKDTQALGPVTLRKGEHLEDYYKRVFEQNRKLTDETKKVADDQAKIVRDGLKAEINEKIKAIEAVAQADQRATQDAKKAADDRIKDIQKVAAEERKASDAKIKAIEAEQKADAKRINDAIKDIERQTAAQTKAIDAQIKALERLARGAAGSFGQIGSSAKAAAVEVAALMAAIANAKALNADNAPGGTSQGTTVPQEGDTQTIAGATWHFHNGSWSPDTIAAPTAPTDIYAPGNLQSPGSQIINALRNWLGGLGPTKSFASGGSMVLREPTALIGLTSGTYHGIAGEAGIETATFTPGTQSGRGGIVIHQTIVNPGMPEIETLVRRGTLAALAEADRVDEVRGYTIR